MNRSLKNTAAVLLATMLTATAIFAGVAGRHVNRRSRRRGAARSATPAASSGVVTASNTTQTTGTLVCPRTNCTASTCHAVTGMPPGQ